MGFNIRLSDACFKNKKTKNFFFIEDSIKEKD